MIPQGQYGAGPVIVWDAGAYENRTKDDADRVVDVADAIERGHVSLNLHGKKLRGGYSLTRLRGGRQPGWLLVKKADSCADPTSDPERDRPESVRSGQDIGQVAAGTDGRPGTRTVAYRLQRAWVGDRRAARMAGSSPAAAPMSSAAAKPPAHASGGMTVAQPLPWA